MVELRLEFTFDTKDTISRWCPGLFRQLQVLHLHFRGSSEPNSLQWDLSTCSLSKLVISIDTCPYDDWPPEVPQAPCLSGVTGVIADAFELHFLVDMSASTPSLECISWSVGHASIYCQRRTEGGLPLCVPESLGALLGCMRTPSLTVNGMTPAAAMAAVAAHPSAAQVAASNATVDSSSDSDSD